MSRNDATGSFLIFLVGIGVGAAAVLLLGSKRIDELRDEYGPAESEPRHPDVETGRPWPSAAGSAIS